MNEPKYRQAEKLFWDSVQLAPTEQRVRLESTGTEVRVQEIGEGGPVLFIHGGPNAGTTWAPMLPHLPGFRCLLLDRPGTGLSDPYAVTEHNLAEFGSRLVGDVLTGLGIEQADVVVSSFGGHLAIRSAASEPTRIRRMVQMACPALAPGESAPPFMKFMTKKVARMILNVLPPNQMANRSIFRQLGHGYSLDHGLLPDGLLDWYLALQKYTDTNRNDGEMIAHVVPNRSTLTLFDDLLASVPTPTLFIWGEDDGFGGEDVARHAASTMPAAELIMIPNSGHLPWLDIPKRAAELTAAFLAGKPTSAERPTTATTASRAHDA